jgi:carbamoyltransferase
LLHEFASLTGCPVLVNTSFNVRGEPIVCTPQDAIRCFLATDMDALVLEDWVILKDDVRGAATDAQREAYLAQFQLD